MLDRLMADVEDRLASAWSLPEHERELVVDDLRGELTSLRSTAAIFVPRPRRSRTSSTTSSTTTTISSSTPSPSSRSRWNPGEVELQVSWAEGQLVVWASGGPARPIRTTSSRPDSRRSAARPTVGRSTPAIALPGGVRADALAISVKDALGWLVAIGGGHGREGLGASAAVVWPRSPSKACGWRPRGAIVPSLRVPGQPQGRTVNDVAALAAGPARQPGDHRTGQRDAGHREPSSTAGPATPRRSAVVSAVVEAIVAESIERMELPASPPTVNSPTDIRDALIANLDGSTFRAPGALAADVARMFETWTRTVTSGARPRLIVQLEAPGAGPGRARCGWSRSPRQAAAGQMHAGRRRAQGRTWRPPAECRVDPPRPARSRSSTGPSRSAAGGSR